MWAQSQGAEEETSWTEKELGPMATHQDVLAQSWPTRALNYSSAFTGKQQAEAAHLLHNGLSYSLTLKFTMGILNYPMHIGEGKHNTPHLPSPDWLGPTELRLILLNRSHRALRLPFLSDYQARQVPRPPLG